MKKRMRHGGRRASAGTPTVVRRRLRGPIDIHLNLIEWRVGRRVVIRLLSDAAYEKVKDSPRCKEWP